MKETIPVPPHWLESLAELVEEAERSPDPITIAKLVGHASSAKTLLDLHNPL